MDTLIEILQRIPDRRLGSVVHIGAGAHALDGIATLDAERVVLIEGDPEVASALRDDMRGLRQGPALQLVEQAVAAMPGTLTWHRYNLRRLNGPLDASGLLAWYPRLRETETLQCEAMPLGATLAALDLPDSDGDARPHVLVMDVPGQEASLLATLDSTWLQRFTWIVLRGCAQQPAQGWRPAREAAQRLTAWSFVCVDGGSSDDVLWPTTVHRFDRERFARLQLTVQLADLQAHAQADAQRVLALQSAHDALDGQLVSARAETERLRADAERQRAEADRQLAAMRAEAERQAQRADALQQQVQDGVAAVAAARADADARVDAVAQQARQAQVTHEAATAALRQACDDATRRAEGLDAALRKTAAAGDELHQLAHALTAQAEALARERDGLAAALAALESRCAALVQERDVAAQAAADAAARLAALQAELLVAQGSLAQAQAASTAEREAAAQKLQSELALARQEAGARVAALTAERDGLAQQLAVLGKHRDAAVQAVADADARHAAVQAELLAAQRHLDQVHAAAAGEREASAQKLQAQVELARQEAGARVAALTAERDGLAQQLAALGKERDEHAHWHRENAQWAQKLKAELDQVRGELGQQQQAAESHGRRADALAQERERLQQQIGERDARQHLLDAEVLKAGAQLDLIKDILIREKNF